MHLTQEGLKEILEYIPETGKFYWRWRNDVPLKWNVRYAFTEAGCSSVKPGCKGRVAISIHKQQFFAHRLAFLWMTGRWPLFEIDHKDTDPANNAWLNLREATSQQNKRNKGPQSNNKCGLKGVSWKKDKKKWRAVIKTAVRSIHLGYFATKEEAAQAYAAAAAKYHSDFARCI